MVSPLVNVSRARLIGATSPAAALTAEATAVAAAAATLPASGSGKEMMTVELAAGVNELSLTAINFCGLASVPPKVIRNEKLGVVPLLTTLAILPTPILASPSNAVLRSAPFVAPVRVANGIAAVSRPLKLNLIEPPVGPPETTIL